MPELPPETKPAGNDVRWVPGYWMWEDNKKDFTWVSGFWRDVPPGREWSPGEWKKQGDQYKYEHGFWKPTSVNQWRVDLPEPPKPLNVEPTTSAPYQGMTWIPGGWVYNDNTDQYAWQPGYWANSPGNMVYQPGQYRMTPNGYAYVPGYWDYCLEDRGLLYAPVYFSRPLWNTPGWYYRPQYALNVGFGTGWGNGAFFTSLSIGPGFGSYYYGPYGSGWSLGLGLFPSYLYGGFGYLPAWAGYAYRSNYPWWYTGGGYYNPLYRKYSTLNGNNPAYAAQVRQSSVGVGLGFSAGGVSAAAVVPIRTSSVGVSGAGTTAANFARVNQIQTQSLIQPAQQVARMQQVAARRTVPAGFSSAKPVMAAAPDYAPFLTPAPGRTWAQHRGRFRGSGSEHGISFE